MVKVERNQRITLWVCVTAGVILGVGLSLIISGKRKPEQHTTTAAKQEFALRAHSACCRAFGQN
jgi:hypothetical protein